MAGGTLVCTGGCQPRPLLCSWLAFTAVQSVLPCLARCAVVAGSKTFTLMPPADLYRMRLRRYTQARAQGAAAQPAQAAPFSAVPAVGHPQRFEDQPANC